MSSEHWFAVACKECGKKIPLVKQAEGNDYRHPLATLAPEEPCADFEEKCLVCGRTEIYQKSDVESTLYDHGGFRVSAAFLQARTPPPAPLQGSEG